MTMYSNSFEQPKRQSVPDEYEAQFVRHGEPPEQSVPQNVCESPSPPPSSGGILSKATSLFRGLETDDLLLIAIGVLLLLDSDEGNDVIVIFIALMLFF